MVTEISAPQRSVLPSVLSSRLISDLTILIDFLIACFLARQLTKYASQSQEHEHYYHRCRSVRQGKWAQRERAKAIAEGEEGLQRKGKATRCVCHTSVDASRRLNQESYSCRGPL